MIGELELKVVKIKDYSVRSEDIARFDENSNDLSIPKILLMESAGLQAVNAICKKYSPTEDSRFLIFCGTGNNGGDGMVIARHLNSRGFFVQLLLCGSPHKIRTEEAKLNWKIVNQLRLGIHITIIEDSSQFEKLKLEKDLIVIDALLGTGVKGLIREPINSAINFINNLPSTIIKISVDVPSGTDPNTGNVPDKSIKADFRVTFHREKIGLESTVNKEILSIGIPIEAEILIGKGDLIQALKKRSKTSKKGDYGKLLTIGGSNQYHGAISFASLAAVELGIDLIQCYVPQSVASSIRTQSPNLIVHAGQGQNLIPKDIENLENLIQWADAIVVGPGMGRSPESGRFFQDILPLLQEKKTVFDADGLYWLSQLPNEQRMILNPYYHILTPHEGELSRFISLENLPTYDHLLKRGEFLVENSKSLHSILLFKGMLDYVINPETLNIRINRTGTSAMSVGGTGDILAGLVGAFLALGNTTEESACAAIYLNGRLGEYVSEQFDRRIKATDMIENIRLLLRNLSY